MSQWGHARTHPAFGLSPGRERTLERLPPGPSYRDSPHSTGRRGHPASGQVHLFEWHRHWEGNQRGLGSHPDQCHHITRSPQASLWPQTSGILAPRNLQQCTWAPQPRSKAPGLLLLPGRQPWGTWGTVRAEAGHRPPPEPQPPFQQGPRSGNGASSGNGCPATLSPWWRSWLSGRRLLALAKEISSERFSSHRALAPKQV